MIEHPLIAYIEDLDRRLGVGSLRSFFFFKSKNSLGEIF